MTWGIVTSGFAFWGAVIRRNSQGMALSRINGGSAARKSRPRMRRRSFWNLLNRNIISNACDKRNFDESNAVETVTKRGNAILSETLISVAKIAE
jgi:hypothetical protein